jgi:chromate transport protein ChrA
MDSIKSPDKNVGGLVAHLGYLSNEFVTKRSWLPDAAYADIVALCQFLPGPASSRLVFALGQLRGGLLARRARCCHSAAEG